MEESDDSESDITMNQNWQRKNKKEINNLDDEISKLESKLGFKNDLKRKKRNNQQANNEGFGIGFMDFIDSIEAKVK